MRSSPVEHSPMASNSWNGDVSRYAERLMESPSEMMRNHYLRAVHVIPRAVMGHAMPYASLLVRTAETVARLGSNVVGLVLTPRSDDRTTEEDFVDEILYGAGAIVKTAMFTPIVIPMIVTYPLP
ncbi:MAG: hypothetical protein HN411_06145 [Waddliaceae bacterium]|jgi:hypothetical protein|nr:hypothetical protein [Waddliaceae bacterium]MBT3578560.1 hypothetical protein [Waddliaceae bacterium]MBT4444705.1 hypothetical protein [Waddliaceae bacterium]MBT6928696.1 hypothetical protein [Waddliaceae bacterium]MBT7264928.1 hypothetical protein [Waddliaceae bacterium]